MSYDDTLEELGETVSGQLVTLYEQTLEGRYTLEQFAQLGGILLEVATGEARIVGRLAFIGWLREAFGIPAAAAVFTDGPMMKDSAESARLAGALETILRESTAPGSDPTGRFRRLARAETADAGHDGYRFEFDTAHPEVTGWRRALNSGACELCRHWAHDGRIWPKDHPMPRHNGCTCVELPIVRGETE